MTIRAVPRRFALRLGSITTRSPTSAFRSRLTTICGPGLKNGSATRNLPWRTSSATRPVDRGSTARAAGGAFAAADG